MIKLVIYFVKAVCVPNFPTVLYRYNFVKTKGTRVNTRSYFYRREQNKNLGFDCKIMQSFKNDTSSSFNSFPGCWTSLDLFHNNYVKGSKERLLESHVTDHVISCLKVAPCVQVYGLGGDYTMKSPFYRKKSHMLSGSLISQIRWKSNKTVRHIFRFEIIKEILSVFTNFRQA